MDASGDIPPVASTLADAVRLAEAELGVRIKFDDRDIGLAPGTGGPLDPKSVFMALNARLTKDAVIVAKVDYPTACGLTGRDGKPLTGTLIIAKAVLWDKCESWLRTYAMEHPDFPHDSTADQWFEEGQFAAYTELGRLIGAKARAVAIDAPSTPSAPAAASNGRAHPAHRDGLVGALTKVWLLLVNAVPPILLRPRMGRPHGKN